MNNLKPTSVDNIRVEVGSIHFPEYETLKTQALQVADYVRSIEVTEENIKDAKKELANANKAVKAIEDRRISIKKEMLKPYDIFETMIKEIVGIVKDADGEVREKVRALEEKEREEKRDLIESEWQKRAATWDYKKYYEFEDFLKPTHLNKTTSMKSIVEEIESFILEKTDDINFLKHSFGEDYVIEYVQNKDLLIRDVIRRMDERKAIQDLASELEEIDDFTEKKKTITIFIIENEKDALLAEMMLKEHDIKFKKETK